MIYEHLQKKKCKWAEVHVMICGKEQFKTGCNEMNVLALGYTTSNEKYYGAKNFSFFWHAKEAVFKGSLLSKSRHSGTDTQYKCYVNQTISSDTLLFSYGCTMHTQIAAVKLNVA